MRQLRREDSHWQRWKNRSLAAAFAMLVAAVAASASARLLSGNGTPAREPLATQPLPDVMGNICSTAKTL
jgi:hypothetical protein